MRYPFAAAIASLFHQNNDKNLNGWKDIARDLLLQAPSKEAVFEEIASRLFDTGGLGSLSSQYDSRLKLLEELDISDMPTLAEPFAKAKQKFKSEVDVLRSRDTERDRARSERFE